MSSDTPSKISRSRAGSGSRARVRITPHSTSTGKPGPPPRTTPYPVFAVPGSMPSTSTRAACVRVSGRSAFELGQLGVVDLEVRPDFLHVIEIFDRLDELEQRLDVGAGDWNGALRHHRELGLRREDAARLERAPHGMKRGRIGGDDVLVVLTLKVLRPRLERRLQRS